MSKENLDDKAKVTSKVKRDDDPDVLFVPDEDKVMNEAIQQARDTVQNFIEALESPKAIQSSFSVKAMLKDDNGVEHIWLADVRYNSSNEVFEGKIGNNPVIIRDKVFGDPVTLKKEEISDWMFLENRLLKGGYTIRVLRESMSPEEKAQFDQQVGFIFEEDGREVASGIHLKDVKANLNTPEGALLSLENAYDAQDFNEAVSCKDFEIEAVLILQEKLRQLEEHEVQPIIAKTAQTLLLSFKKVFEEGGFPSFKNTQRVYYTNYLNESIAQITEEITFEDGQQKVEKVSAIYTEKGWKILAPL